MNLATMHAAEDTGRRRYPVLASEQTTHGAQFARGFAPTAGPRG
ncbi:hypothetical protein [Ancylobacter sp. Lp-2]|nr:hypothetical protein [Ancylobacter sp. Lp-2]